ncbi:MAG: MBL fold metallo-hydrolase [Candidatus Sulfomarinibacteraceae bacterium]
MAPNGRVSAIIAGFLIAAFSDYGTAAATVPTPSAECRRVGDTILVVDAEGTNCVVIAGSDGLVVIDTGPGPAAATLVKEAAANAFGRSDVAFVISTHCHWDHVDGNQVFAGVPIVAQASCPEAMERAFADRSRLSADPGPAAAPPPPPPGTTLPPPAGAGPARTVGPAGEGERMGAALRDRFAEVRLTLPRITFNDTLTLDLGDRSLRLIAYGGGHSSSDTLIVVPEEGLLVSGDLFFHGELPLVTGDGNPEPERWMTALDALDDHPEIRTVIPGHGEPVTPEELLFFKRYIRWLVSQTGPAISGDPASADSMLRGALSDENLPAPKTELDPEIAATIHRANVTALVERPRPADQEDHRQEPPPDHEPTRQTESGVAG